MLRKYDLDFYLLGWLISIYPSVLSYYYFKSKWTSYADLKLTFHEL